MVMVWVFRLRDLETTYAVARTDGEAPTKEDLILAIKQRKNEPVPMSFLQHFDSAIRTVKKNSDEEFASFFRHPFPENPAIYVAGYEVLVVDGTERTGNWLLNL